MSEQKEVVIQEKVFLQLVEGLKVWRALNEYATELENEPALNTHFTEEVLDRLKTILNIVQIAEGNEND